MKKEVFKLQLSMLGLVPKSNTNMDAIYEKFNSIDKKFGEASHGMAELWQYVEPEKLNLEWTDVEYAPEASMQKRTITLAEKIMQKTERKYPEFADFEKDADWEHLVQHGKLGLMSLLFIVEKEDPKAKIEKIAPMIEACMVHIESLFEQLIENEHREAIVTSLQITDDKHEDLNELIHGRLQAFTMMRGVYLEKEVSGLTPLQWWVQNERYIPNLPE